MRRDEGPRQPERERVGEISMARCPALDIQTAPANADRLFDQRLV